MPHECTTCSRTFPDGSKEMLSGCPDCGGNKFQYHPGTVSEESSYIAPPDEDSTGTVDASANAGESADSSFEFGPSASSTPVDESEVMNDASSEADVRSDEDGGQPLSDADRGQPRSGEDRAQASARSTVVSEDELALSTSEDPSEPIESRDFDSDADQSIPDSADAAATDSEEVPADSEESGSPELAALREELNEQFESIKIHERGEYELNLMELYDREEHIVALQEDGRYVIDVPSSWREEDEPE